MSIADEIDDFGVMIAGRLSDIRDRIGVLERALGGKGFPAEGCGCEHEPLEVSAAFWRVGGTGMIKVPQALVVFQALADDKGNIGGPGYAIRLCRKCRLVYWSEVASP